MLYVTPMVLPVSLSQKITQESLGVIVVWLTLQYQLSITCHTLTVGHAIMAYSHVLLVENILECEADVDGKCFQFSKPEK